MRLATAILLLCLVNSAAAQPDKKPAAKEAITLLTELLDSVPAGLLTPAKDGEWYQEDMKIASQHVDKLAKGKRVAFTLLIKKVEASNPVTGTLVKGEILNPSKIVVFRGRKVTLLIVDPVYFRLPLAKAKEDEYKAGHKLNVVFPVERAGIGQGLITLAPDVKPGIMAEIISSPSK